MVSFGRGWHNHEGHLRGYGHRRQSRLSAGKMGCREYEYPVKGMFCKNVRNFSGARMFLPETKQHLVPIQANIPDKANRAVLPYYLNLGRLSQQVLPKEGGVSKGEGLK